MRTGNTHTLRKGESVFTAFGRILLGILRGKVQGARGWNFWNEIERTRGCFLV